MLQLCEASPDYRPALPARFLVPVPANREAAVSAVLPELRQRHGRGLRLLQWQEGAFLPTLAAPKFNPAGLQSAAEFVAGP